MWRVDVVSLGRYPSLAIDTSGEPVLAFRGGAFPDVAITYAFRAGGIWQFEEVSPETASLTTVAMSSTGVPWVAFMNHSTQELRIAHREPTGWVVETLATSLDPPVEFMSLRLDVADNPAIAYRDVSDGILYYMSFDGQSWTRESIDSNADFVRPMHTGDFVALGTGTNGYPIAAYYSYCDSNPRIAYWSGPAVLHRLPVDVTVPGWKAPALPLTSLNDDETLPFPISTVVPGVEQDTLPASEPLVMYRILWPVDAPARNSVRVVKGAGGVDISF